MTSIAADPITVATVWHGMRTICYEMRHVIERTAQNYLIGQVHDVSVGIWAADGATVAMPIGLPVQFLGTHFAIKSMVERFRGNLAPGDVILTNDPYHGGHNCHLPDWGFFRPIFYRNELLFFTLARAHQQDTGGAFPGGYFPNAYDIHAEGICIPPIKVYEADRERSDVLELIWNNVRWPEAVKIDNYAMLAATRMCEQRLVALLDKYGKETALNCVRQMIDRTEKAVRAEIRKMPDGTYYGDAATDDDGTVLDEPVWVRVEVTIRDDEMVIDFSKSDGQRKGFVNSVYATTYAGAIASACVVMDQELADYHNEGTMRPITVIAPPGTVVNAQYPATVGASPVNVGTQVQEAVQEALSKALPERAFAAKGRHRGDYVFAVDPRTGERYVRTSFDYDGSTGAVYGNDGYTGVVSRLGAVNRGNVEEAEVRIPWRHLRYELATDLTGAGKWRGGHGVIWEAVNEGTDGGMATGSSDGDEMLGHGALGGHPTPPCRTYLRRGDDLIRVKPHRMVEVKRGDVLVKHSSGGAGVGPPEERDPEKVRQDVSNELVSLEAARNVYRVVLDPLTLEIDHAETKRLRAETSEHV
jgi:N-methylhydantoinase B